MAPPESRNEFVLALAPPGALLFGFGLNWMPSGPALAVFFGVVGLLALGFGLISLLRPENITGEKLRKSWKLFAYGAVGLMAAVLISSVDKISG